MLNFFNYKTLELAITDFCNLDCLLCSQGTPLQTEKKTMSVDDLLRISKFIKPFEFDTIKLSGGEPTLHPQFDEICKQIRKMFPARNYLLATNGFKLEKFKDYLYIFNEVNLVHYPGKNNEVFEQILKLKLPNITVISKRDYIEMEDVYQKRNLTKTCVFEYCIYSRIKKVVGNRIYPCCVIFGQSIRNHMDINTVSVIFDKHWRENLSKINIECYCRNCFVDVSGYSFWKANLKSFLRRCKTLYIT